MIDKTKAKFKELLCYGFFPSGIGFNNKNILEDKDYVNLKLLECQNRLARNELLNLDYIEYMLNFELRKLKGKKVTLLFSGGIDSTLLAVYMKKLGINFELLNLEYNNYSEKTLARYVADEVLDMPIKIINITPEQLLKDLPNILRLMPSPYERGSVLMSYYLMKEAGDYVVTGDSADCLFSPSFEKEVKGIENGYFKHEYIEESDVQLIKPKKRYKYLTSKSDVLNDMLLFNVINEQPFYNYAKYWHFKRRTQKLVMPYFNTNLLLYTLSCKTLHELPYKYYLKKIMQKYTNLNFKKIAFKVEREDFDIITNKYFEDDLLYYYTNHTIKDFKSKEKIKFITALYNAWRIANGQDTRTKSKN